MLTLSEEFTKEHSWIRQKQQEFETIFGRTLVIKMKTRSTRKMQKEGRHVGTTGLSAEDYLKHVIEKYNADLGRIRRSRRIEKYSPEKLAIIDFCKATLTHPWDPEQCALLLNKSRSTLYHYARNY